MMLGARSHSFTGHTPPWEDTHSVTWPSVQVLYFNYNSATLKTTVAQNNTKNRFPALNPMSIHVPAEKPAFWLPGSKGRGLSTPLGPPPAPPGHTLKQ